MRARNSKWGVIQFAFRRQTSDRRGAECCIFSGHNTHTYSRYCSLVADKDPTGIEVERLTLHFGTPSVNRTRVIRNAYSGHAIHIQATGVGPRAA